MTLRGSQSLYTLYNCLYIPVYSIVNSTSTIALIEFIFWTVWQNRLLYHSYLHATLPLHCQMVKSLDYKIKGIQSNILCSKTDVLFHQLYFPWFSKQVGSNNAFEFEWFLLCGIHAPHWILRLFYIIYLFILISMSFPRIFKFAHILILLRFNQLLFFRITIKLQMCKIKFNPLTLGISFTSVVILNFVRSISNWNGNAIRCKRK